MPFEKESVYRLPNSKKDNPEINIRGIAAPSVGIGMRIRTEVPIPAEPNPECILPAAGK